MGKSEQALADERSVAVLRDSKASERNKQIAFNDLFKQHNRQLLVWFIKRLNGDVETSEDLLMVTFEKVHKYVDKFDSKRAVFSTWMYEIAKNTLIDHKRKDKFEVLSLDGLSSKTGEDHEGMEFQIDSGTKNPEQKLVHDQDIEMVTDAIYSLESDFVKELLTCRYIDDLSFAETAKKMGVKDNSTLRVNIKRGITLLKKQLVAQ